MALLRAAQHLVPDDKSVQSAQHAAGYLRAPVQQPKDNDS
jgi:hypothetical protein